MVTFYQCKIWASFRKLFVPLGVPSWLRVCWLLLLVTSVSYATQFSLFTIKFFRFNIKY